MQIYRISFFDFQKNKIEQINRLSLKEVQIKSENSGTKLTKKVVGPHKLPQIDAVFDPEELKDHLH